MKFHWREVRPVIDTSVRNLCSRPYPNHPKGCPNYGKRDMCPPQSPLLWDKFDENMKVYALWADFDLGAHVRRMKEKHPEWSYRQLSCCLYWQGTARKFMKKEAFKWLSEFDTARMLGVTACPEAMGVNVTATMKSIGVELEWPPKNITRVIWVAGVRRRKP